MKGFLTLMLLAGLAQANPGAEPPGPARAAATASSEAVVGDIGLQQSQEVVVNIEAPPAAQAPQSVLSTGPTNVSVQTINPDKLKIRNTAAARPPVIMSVSPCRVPVSAGLGIPGFNGGAGTAVEDHECTLRQTAQLFAEMGLPGMGLWMLCRSQAVARVQEVHERPKAEREAAADEAAERCDGMVAQFQIEAELSAPPLAQAQDDYQTVAQGPSEAAEQAIDQAMAELRAEQKRLEEATERLRRDYQRKISGLQAQIQGAAPGVGPGMPATPATVVEVEQDPEARARYDRLRQRLLAAQQNPEWRALKARAREYEDGG